jgi:hypothetical protein
VIVVGGHGAFVAAFRNRAEIILAHLYPQLRSPRRWRSRRARIKSDGVTGYVTSSHGAATPLRYGVTGHLAGNQPVRSRQAIVSLMNRPTASTIV